MVDANYFYIVIVFWPFWGRAILYGAYMSLAISDQNPPFITSSPNRHFTVNFVVTSPLLNTSISPYTGESHMKPS